MGTKHGSIDIEDRSRKRRKGLSDITPEKRLKNEEIMERKINNYASNLEIRYHKISVINDRRNELEKILSEELSINEKHIIGSYARNTMIESIEGNDVDIMLVIDNTKHGYWMEQENGPTNCLQTVKRIIQNNPKFKNTEVLIDRNAVTVKYRDFSIDIVPAFTDKNGGYRIPDTYKNQTWLRTNPRMFKKIMNASDRANNGRISKIVKIAKGWNEAHGKPLKSFHIETMVYDHFKNRSKTENRSLKTDVNDFLSRLPWYIRNSSYDPVYGDRIDTYLTPNNREATIKKAQYALSKVAKGEEFKNNDNISKSISEYQKAFGKKFS